MLQNGTTKLNKRTKKNMYCNTRGLIEQGVLGIVIGVVILVVTKTVVYK